MPMTMNFLNCGGEVNSGLRHSWTTRVVAHPAAASARARTVRERARRRMRSIFLVRVYRPKNSTGPRMVPGARASRTELAKLLVRELDDHLERAIGRRRADLAHDEALTFALEQLQVDD